MLNQLEGWGKAILLLSNNISKNLIHVLLQCHCPAGHHYNSIHQQSEEFVLKEMMLIHMEITESTYTHGLQGLPSEHGLEGVV